jgi:hypothetical protein
MPSLVQHFLPLQRIRELYRRAQQPVNRSLLEDVLAEMKVEYPVADSDQARARQPVPWVVTANHPFGLHLRQERAEDSAVERRNGNRSGLWMAGPL